MIPRSLGRLQPRLDKSKIDSLVSSALWSSSPAAKSHGDKRVLGTSSLPKTIGFVVSIHRVAQQRLPTFRRPLSLSQHMYYSFYFKISPEWLFRGVSKERGGDITSTEEEEEEERNRSSNSSDGSAE
ncbi:hypothetical protein PABG_06636 [Paracoccidioides brasiliensis Pb03]|nr:hypothetical protein PABG_06636 [Paracoccidioides brasiliensis Pb03]